METAAYLHRIGIRIVARPTIDFLRMLHRRHLLSVPFESLDIYLGRSILLDQRSFYKKIVEEGRGGYCYELNGSFSWLLRRLGFKVSMLSARVARSDGGYNPEFDHMTLLVQLRERWLVDVGFGDSFTEPLRLDTEAPQRDSGRQYRIVGKSQRRTLQRWDPDNGSWKPQYSFSLRNRKLSDFAARNHYQQTSPRSHFTHGPMVSTLTSKGRITLTGKKLVVTRGRRRVERRVRNKNEFERLLAKHFRIRFGPDSRLHLRRS